MIIHFYLSEKRVKDLVFQLDPKYLTETTKKVDKELTVKGEVKGGVPKWMQFLGFSGEATLGTEGKIALSEEIKPLSIEYAVLSILKKVILENDFNYVDMQTNFTDFNEDKNIIRVKGRFKMCVEGVNAMDRIAKFETMPYIEWEGTFNDCKIKFGTSKESYTARTAVFQCLTFPDISAEIDFFGVVTRIQKNIETAEPNLIDVLPLFFGLEIDIL